MALAVLLGVLVWVGGGGLDLNPSSHADDGQTGKTPHGKGQGSEAVRYLLTITREWFPVLIVVDLQ